LSKSTPKRHYLIPAVSKALDVLEFLQNEHAALGLEAIHQGTNISKTTIYRIVKTLVHRRYLAQSHDGLYNVVSRPRKTLFGFGCQAAEMPFSDAVTKSLQSAATAADIELVVLENRYDGATALRNADEFLRRGVDLLIECQIDQSIAPIIADKIDAAAVPLIAVDIPYPLAFSFGVNNYRVGFEAGEYLGRHATKTWGNQICWVLGLDIEAAGPLVQSRITGAFEGVRSRLRSLPSEYCLRLDTRGLPDKSYRLVLDFLRQHPKDRGIVIAAATHTIALGAVQAVRELRREKDVAIVGQDCISEALEEMARDTSPLIASVSHEAYSYGPKLIQLGLAIISGQYVAPYHYVEHRLVTASSIRGGIGLQTSRTENLSIHDK
jgi:ribose transport system substrate-binding protein